MSVVQEADEIETNDEPVEEVEVDEQEAEQSEEGDEESGAETEAAADDEVVVTIGDETPPADEDEAASAPIRALRKANREKEREIRELKAKVAAVEQPKPAALGEKPTLEACDYDTDDFEAKLTQWHDRKRVAEAEERKKQDEAQAAQAEWDAQLQTYGKLKSSLKVKDFEDAEATAQEILSVTQQGIILTAADNAANLVYALGRNPEKAKQLAAITNPVKFAFAVAKLETQLKVTPRKAAPLPETVVRGSARVSGAVDSQLERLREKADRTGDRTEVAAYMRQQQARSKK